MEIRRLTTQELMQAIYLCQHVYNICVRPSAQPEVQQFFDDYMKQEYLLPQMECGQLLLWGGFEGAFLIAVGAMTSDGQITMLYVLPECQRRQYGKRLLSEMRRFAGTELGLARVSVNATPAWASRYFSRNDFLPLNHRQNLSSPYMGMYARTFYYNKQPVRHLKGWVKALIYGGTITAGVGVVIGYMLLFILQRA